MASSSYFLYLSLLLTIACFGFGDSQNVNITNPIYLRYSEKGHLADLYIGIPPRRITVTFDTGSNLFWVKSSKAFDLRGSSSIFRLPCYHPLCQPIGKLKVGCESACMFEQIYGDETWLRGFMAADTLTLGDTLIPNLVIGYTTAMEEGVFDDTDGIMGFARGGLSFLAQLGVNEFSYCLTNATTPTSTPLLLGEQAVIKPNLRRVAKSIPLVRSPGDPSHYYVAMEGITVGDIQVDIPPSSFQVNGNGIRGVLLDAGSQALMLAPDCYPKVMKAFADQMNAEEAWDDYSLAGYREDWEHYITSGTGIYSRPISKNVYNMPVPKLILHFKGGVDFEVPLLNYVENPNFEGDEMRHINILNSDMDGVSLLGNFFQQNMQVVHDLKREKVWFAPTDCSQF